MHLNDCTMKYCFALDLKDDKALISEYEQWHQAVWPEIIDAIKESGILELEIYRVANRLFMIMQADENFSFERKRTMDAANEVVQRWEALMWKYQQALPEALPGEKWMLMTKVFEL